MSSRGRRSKWVAGGREVEMGSRGGRWKWVAGEGGWELRKRD